MTVVRTLSLCACAALLCLAPIPHAWGRSTAAADNPWPPFTVSDLAGTEVQSTSLAPEGRWLMVYVTPTSDPAIEWLRLFETAPLADLAPRLAIVVGETDREGAAALRERLPALHTARWYVDTTGTAHTALSVSGVPFAWGMNGAGERWRLVGVLPDKAVLVSLLQTWVSQ
jgi:hypothetical protein